MRTDLMLCDTAAPLRAQKECMYKRITCIHRRHGSGAVIASRNTGIVTCCLVERNAPGESVERRAPGDAGVKPVKRNEAVDQWLRSRSDQAWVSTGVEHGG